MKKEKKAWIDDKIYKHYNGNTCVRCGTTFFAYKSLCQKCKNGIQLIWIEIHERVLRKGFDTEYNNREKEAKEAINELKPCDNV